jgi:hypothetical protein
MYASGKRKRKETSTDLLTPVCSLKYAYLIADIQLDSKPKKIGLHLDVIQELL